MIKDTQNLDVTGVFCYIVVLVLKLNLIIRIPTRKNTIDNDKHKDNKIYLIVFD